MGNNDFRDSRHSKWDETTERRRVPRNEPVSEYDRLINDLETYIDDRIKESRDSTKEHFDSKLDTAVDEIKGVIKEAFPNGDPGAHRRLHEQEIERASWWDKLKTEIIYKSASGGAWVALGFLALALWEHFKREVIK